MMQFFIHDPEEYQTQFFKTSEEWQTALNSYDFLGKYCEDGWSEGVTAVIAGIITDRKKYNPDHDEEYDFYLKHATHSPQQCHLRECPNDTELDEDMRDSEGTYWGDWDYICDYTFQKIERKKAL